MPTQMNSIKTYFKIADNWYIRTIKLKMIAIDDNEPLSRQHKAFRLYVIMFGRMSNLIKKINESDAMKLTKFENGGYELNSI